MRTKLAFAGLGVGVVAALAPLAPASAECQPPPTLVNTGSSAGNECQPNGCQNYDALKAKLRVLPDRPFDCTL
jgi:hypothetical protein